MKFFLDTANIDEIRTANEWGILDGVTTNPSLAAKEGREFREVAAEILELLGDRPVSLETVSTTAEGIIREARLLASWAPNVVAKVPLLPEGLKALRVLREEGIKTNVTLVFSTNQGLLAGKAGATYVSPFIGRLDDRGHDGMQIVREMVEIFDIYGIETQVLTASVRHPRHVVEAALAGTDVITMPFAVMKKMFQHPFTDAGLAKFLADWETVPDKDEIFRELSVPA
ncbi:MAG: fructose-6-phosphate aldolase [Chloroflexi bacterium]|nr:MAG: fructose-6-phosphate aldolase [Chloroflexota bacterium]